MSKLKQGDRATMFHAGTNSFYEVCVREAVTFRQMAEEEAFVVAQEISARATKVAAKTAAKPSSTKSDGLVLRETLAAWYGKDKMMFHVYNDVSKDKKTRRLKMSGIPAAELDNKVSLDLLLMQIISVFGNRIVEIGRTNYKGSYGQMERDLFIRLKA